MQRELEGIYHRAQIEKQPINLVYLAIPVDVSNQLRSGAFIDELEDKQLERFLRTFPTRPCLLTQIDKLTWFKLFQQKKLHLKMLNCQKNLRLC